MDTGCVACQNVPVTATEPEIETVPVTAACTAKVPVLVTAIVWPPEIPTVQVPDWVAATVPLTVTVPAIETGTVPEIPTVPDTTHGEVDCVTATAPATLTGCVACQKVPVTATEPVIVVDATVTAPEIGTGTLLVLP